MSVGLVYFCFILLLQVIGKSFLDLIINDYRKLQISILFNSDYLTVAMKNTDISVYKKSLKSQLTSDFDCLGYYKVGL